MDPGKPGERSEAPTQAQIALESVPPDPAEPLPVLRPGYVLFGKYRIDRIVAEGGMGIVLAATHLHLNQKVAIKYLKAAAVAQKSVVERFLREARLASQIRSDHVVRVHDVGQLDDGSPYMVMEYLEGADLGQELERGPLLLRTAIDYVLQACDALAEAHAMGIVHRDLKPGNLFLAKRAGGSSIVKIIDFGISRIAPSRSPSGTWEHVTTANEIFGTPVYMAPEQLRSATNVDQRTDIWALGVVLHELLTTTMPFNGETIPQLCTSILGDPPIPLTRVRSNAPAEIEAIILRCLEKDRTRRYRNVAELAQELAPFGPESAAARVQHIKRVIQEGGASVRPPAPSRGSLDMLAMAPGSAPPPELSAQKRRSTRILLGATSMIGVAALGLVVYLAARTGGSKQEVPSASATPAATSQSEPVRSALDIAPDPIPPPSASEAPTSPPSTASVSPRKTPRHVASPTSPGSPSRLNAEFGERQ